MVQNTPVRRGHAPPPLTCVYDGGPGLDVDGGRGLFGAQDPGEVLSGEDTGSFTDLEREHTRLNAFIPNILGRNPNILGRYIDR